MNNPQNGHKTNSYLLIYIAIGERLEIAIIYLELAKERSQTENYRSSTCLRGKLVPNTRKDAWAIHKLNRYAQIVASTVC